MNPRTTRDGSFASAPRKAAEIENHSLRPIVADQVLPDDVLPLRLKSVAQLTEMSEKTVRRWIQRGQLRSHKLGGARVVRKCDLRTFLDEQAGQTNKERP